MRKCYPCIEHVDLFGQIISAVNLTGRFPLLEEPTVHHPSGSHNQILQPVSVIGAGTPHRLIFKTNKGSEVSPFLDGIIGMSEVPLNSRS